MKTQNGIIHLGLILVLLIFGIGALVFVMYKTNSLPVVTTSSPTPEAMMEERENMTNWKSYTNKYFLFKYPGDIEIRSSAESNVHGYIKGEKIFEFSYQHSSGSYTMPNSIKTAQVGGKAAEVFEGENGLGEGETDPTVLYTIRDSNTLTQLIFYGHIPLSDLQTQILSTFEFVDNTDNPKTKTYQDNSIGTKFNYPNSWYVQKVDQWTFSVMLEDRPFVIPDATEFSTSIQINLNEALNTVTNNKFYQEKTLYEGLKRLEQLFDSSTVNIQTGLKISNKEAARINGNWGPGMLEGDYFDYTIIQLDGRLLIVSLHGQKYLDVYRQIVDSIQFTK